MVLFYKDNQNTWWVGLGLNIHTPSGNWKMSLSDDRTSVRVFNENKMVFVSRITDIVKNDQNETYADYEEFKTAVSPFFVNAPGGEPAGDVSWGNITGDPSDNQALADYVADHGGGRIIEVTVDTAAGISAKIGTTATGDYVPRKGDVLQVIFINVLNNNSPTLNIDGSGAKNIRLGGGNVTLSTGNISLYVSAGGTIRLYYDGEFYQAYGVTYNTQYVLITENEILEGGLTTRSISGQRAQFIKNLAKSETLNEADDISQYEGFDLNKKIALVCDHGVMKWQEIE